MFEHLHVHVHLHLHLHLHLIYKRNVICVWRFTCTCTTQQRSFEFSEMTIEGAVQQGIFMENFRTDIMKNAH